MALYTKHMFPSKPERFWALSMTSPTPQTLLRLLFKKSLQNTSRSLQWWVSLAIRLSLMSEIWSAIQFLMWGIKQAIQLDLTSKKDGGLTRKLREEPLCPTFWKALKEVWGKIDWEVTAYSCWILELEESLFTAQHFSLRMQETCCGTICAVWKKIY